ncbi:MAG: cytochrome c peroxidase [Candidatus Promineifilaceae bacterium]|jgi:cytochrome c peroxidase
MNPFYLKMMGLLGVSILVLAPLATAGPATITLEVRHLWKGEPIAFPSDDLVLGDDETLQLTRLSYLLSYPRFKRAQSTTNESPWLEQRDWFGFVDAESNLTRLSLSGLPRETFNALQFNIGLNKEADESDPNQYPASHPLNPVYNRLHWSWQGSYIFLALEGRLIHDEADLGFSYHLGNQASLMNVMIPLDFTLDKDALIILDFHLDRVFSKMNAAHIADQTSTHGRAGDALAVQLRKRIEHAFTLHDIRRVEATEKSAPVKTLDVPGFVGTPYRFRMPRGFPIPALPIDYPLTEERVALGEKLFHDPLLSAAGTISCASCHQHDAGFSDSRRFSPGDEGQLGSRQSMPIFNLAWKSSFFWDGRAPSLREQALVPIEDPVEMHESLEHVIGKLAKHAEYPARFEAAFGDKTITEKKLGVAVEQFVLTLTSFDSKFDQAYKGKAQLTELESRGFELFFTEHDPRRRTFGADCFHCHGGAFFTDHSFHNNGLSPALDFGREKHTGLQSDRNKFSTPSLRNVALTPPYMHDGRFATLEDVLKHYAGEMEISPTLDPNLAKHGKTGMQMSAADQAAIIAFLRSLSDPQFSDRNTP